jgi:hypothetical protein
MAASARVTEANPSFVFHQFVDQTNEFNCRMKPQFMLHRDLNGHTNVCSSAHPVTIDTLTAEFGASRAELVSRRIARGDASIRVQLLNFLIEVLNAALAKTICPLSWLMMWRKLKG